MNIENDIFLEESKNFERRIDNISYYSRQTSDLVASDLMFIYNPPLSVKNDNDLYSKILEVRSGRNIKKDLSGLYRCSEGEVAIFGTEVSTYTMVLLSSLNLRGRRKDMYRNLKYILGNLDCSGAQFKRFNTLLSVGRNLNLTSSFITSLGSLIEVRGNIDLNGSKVNDLGNLESVSGNIYCYRSCDKKVVKSVKDLQNDGRVQGRVYFKDPRS